MGCLFLFLTILGYSVMSDEQNEVNNLKRMLDELSKRVDDNISNHKNIVEETQFEEKADSKTYLKIYELQKELEESELRNQLQEQKLTDLKEECENLRVSNDKKIKVIDSYINQAAKNEEKNRKLFELYAKDKEEIFKYQLLVDKLRQDFSSLKNELDKQERRYENLKNQISYKLGNRLVGIRKPKDLLKLPKTLLDDYVSVKSKINNSSALALSFQDDSQKKSLPYINSKEYTIFKNSVTLPLKSKVSTLIFNDNFKGALQLQLYGVKPSTSVDIELSIHLYHGDCVLKVMPEHSNVHHIVANEVMKINITISDDQPHQFMDIISTSGMIEVTFRKTRGVPSIFHLYTNNTQSKVINELEPVNSNKKIVSNKSQNNAVIPKLKQKNSVFTEAWVINENQSFELAKSFIEKYAPLNTLSTLYVFEANNYLNNDYKWLSLVNKYISSYNMQPIKLRSGKEEKYHRITSETEYAINESIKISVIMPAFDAEKTIEMAMDSILQQTWQNLELIVINDHSTDRTLEIVNKVVALDKRVKVINNPCNVGAYVSKNLGLKLATGNYITGHDADDWAHPQRLEKHMQLIQSESKPPRASLTRMIRMEENGFLRMYKISTFCHDGVLRIASITCMFETNFLKNILGGWDCARFGADSEIISRAQIVLGDEFKSYETFSMICLDEPTSLTNNPIHGVSKTTGISPSRKFYKNQWLEWHKTINKSNVYLEFPHLVRNFDLPDGTEIPEQNIIAAINNVN